MKGAYLKQKYKKFIENVNQMSNILCNLFLKIKNVI